MCCNVMDSDYVVDLEREVEEFLLIWSSLTPKGNDEVGLRDSTPECAALGVDQSPASEVIADRAATKPIPEAEDHNFGRRHLCRGRRLRNTGRGCHPYRGGKRTLVSLTPSRTYKGSYVAELKATWPTRY